MIVGKIYYKESSPASFKAFIKKQDTYCLRYRKRTDNKSITPKQMVNKLIAQKSICVDVGSKKSVFVKEHKLEGKQKEFLQITKHAYLL